MVWNWWTGRVSSLAIKASFGMFNLYDLDNKSQDRNENHVEKLFADLECAMGAIVKKIEDILRPPNNGKPASVPSVHLLESEIYTVYKFIGLSGFRNGPVGLCVDDDILPNRIGKQMHQEWVAKLEFLLQESHEELLIMDELLQPHIVRPIISRYKQLGRMKLHFWAAPEGEEFLLSNLFVGLEGYQNFKQDSPPSNIRLPAHVYIPVGPEILMVLCAETLCQQSLLRSVQHAVTTPFDRPARGKVGKADGRKRFQPMVQNWKTTYPITPLYVDDVYTINGFILAASNLVVYRSRATLDRNIDNILPFSDKHAIWNKEYQQSTPKIESAATREEYEQRRQLQYLVFQLIRKSIRPIFENADEKVQEQISSQVEILEKAAYHMFSANCDLFMLSILLKPSIYFMGDKKV